MLSSEIPSIVSKVGLKNVPIGDPVLFVEWNLGRLEELGITKDPIVNDIIEHGGRELNNSQSLFHFKHLQDMGNCRRWLLANRRVIFGTTPEMVALGAMQREPVGESYVVAKITQQVCDSDDARFFYL